MATITCLPEEMIAIILGYDNISIEDIISFSSTCKIFRQMIQTSKFWEKKFYLRCSSAKKKYNIEKQKEIFGHLNFREKITASVKCIEKLRYYVSLMSNNNLCNTDKIELEDLLRFIAEDSVIHYFVSDELNRIISHLSSFNSNLTNKYNFRLIFHCIQKYRFIYKQIKFINISEKKQLLERQLTIIAQYFKPHVSYSVITTWLDDIAQEVLSRLKYKFPAHSIFSTSSEQFSFWKENNIDDNFWNPIEATQIMHVLEEFVFSELEGHKLKQLWISLDLENKTTNYIANYFRHYFLPIIYYIIARRLGIRYMLMPQSDEIYSKKNLVIIWKPKFNSEDWDNAEFFYIDDRAYLFYPSNIIKGKSSEYICTCSYIWITKVIMSELMKEWIKFNDIYYKWKLDILIKFLTRASEENLQDIEIKYKNITKEIEIRSDVAIRNQLQRRNGEIKFAVGMIVTHSCRFFDIHYGVIIGWHCKCNRKLFRDQLKKTFIYRYLHKCDSYAKHICLYEDLDQPHYMILTTNNIICYVRQDAIRMLRSPQWISNVLIGRFFCRFENTHFVANETLAKDYQDDVTAIVEILSNL